MRSEQIALEKSRSLIGRKIGHKIITVVGAVVAVGLIGLVLFYLIAIFSEFFAPYPPRLTSSMHSYAPPMAIKLFVEKDGDRQFLMHVEGYKAHPERAVLISVAALEWNCPQHIPVRLTRDELEPHLLPLKAELARLRAENAELRAWLGKGG